MGSALVVAFSIFLLVLFGEYLIPEPVATLKFNNNDYVFPGRRFKIDLDLLYEKYLRDGYGPSRHMTVVFAIFTFSLYSVMMTILWVSFRSISIITMIFIPTIQFLVIEYGSVMVGCNHYGITTFQGLITICISLVVYLISLILSKIQLGKKFPKLEKKEVQDENP